MSRARISGRFPARVAARAGFTLRGVLVVLTVVAAVLVAAWLALPRLWQSRQDDGPMMYVVQRGRFIHDITERGNLESANNVEIASKVKSTTSGIPILEVVAEGTLIEPEDCIPENAVIPLAAIKQLEQYRRELERGKARGIAAQDQPARSGDDGNGDGHSGSAKPKPKPAGGAPGTAKAKRNAKASASASDDSGGAGAVASGDQPPGVQDERNEGGNPDAPVLGFEDIRDKLVLVRLNSKSLDDQRMQQQIVCETSRATVTQAQSNYDTAVISKEEYLHGDYEKKRLKAESDLLLAEDKLARAREYLDYSKLLHAKGYLSDSELESAGFDVKQKELDLKNVEKEQDVLERFTKKKMLKQLEADIETAQAKLSAATKSYELDLTKLTDTEEQIVNCTMFSTKPGQVVYANQTNRYGSNEIVIEAGTPIRERQVILRLPDPTQMQVDAKINEAKVSLVEPGMSTAIRLEASPDEVLQGRVTDVGEYPAPTSWYKGDVKEYKTTIEILGLDENPRKDLRPGLTAEVKIRVAELSDVLQVPIQAVLEHGGVHYCVVPSGDGQWEAREVSIGSSNDKFVVIRGGLEEGESVVHHAAKFRDKLDLPELKEDEAPGAKPSPDASVPSNPKPGRDARPPRGRGPNAGSAGRSTGLDPATVADRILKRQDKNGNGKLDGAEIPGDMKANLKAVDRNGDGAIDRAELTAAIKQRAGRGSKPGAPGPQGKAVPGSRRPGGPKAATTRGRR